MATVSLEKPHGGVAYEYFLPSGPFAILPLTENRASLVWTEKTLAAEALRTARPEALLSLLRRRFGPFLGRVEVVGPTFVYPLSMQLAERLTAPRLALLGDAAHGIHPIAGQGLNLGLKDAAALSQVLVDAVRLGEDIGSAAVLERYAAWRRFDNVRWWRRWSCSPACSPTTSRRSGCPRPGHVGGQPPGLRPPLLHAGSRRRRRRPAPPVPRPGALAGDSPAHRARDRPSRSSRLR